MSDTYTGDLNVGDVTAVFDALTTYSGPFEAGTYQTLVENRAKNDGTVKGLINIKFDALNSDGTVKVDICNVNRDVSAAYCVNLRYHEEYGQACAATAEISCGTGPYPVTIETLTAGTYYYGIKTWGETEAEPSYPVPDSAGQPANAKAWSVVVEEPSEPNGDITKVALDSKTLPEDGTLNWLVNDDVDVKVYFKNTGNVASTFDIWVTDEDGATLCSKTTGEIAADGAEYYIDCGTFTPGAVETKTLTAHIDP